jgi:selenocysteine-specific translation elongation factor
MKQHGYMALRRSLVRLTMPRKKQKKKQPQRLMFCRSSSEEGERIKPGQPSESVALVTVIEYAARKQLYVRPNSAVQDEEIHESSLVLD